MVFISGTPDDDRLVIREAPFVIASIMAAITAGVFARSFALGTAGDGMSMGITFAMAVVSLFITGMLLWLRTSTFERASRTLTVRDARVFRRTTERHGLPDGTQAELVVSHDSDGDDLYRATLMTEDGKSIELDGGQSFPRPSARIVMAVNMWMEAP